MSFHINLNQLRSFYYTALYSSMSAASERLHVSVPAVSTQIGKFEEWLGYQLFIRTRNTLTLTEKGKDMFTHAERIFEHIEALEQSLYSQREQSRTAVLLGTHHVPAKYCMADVLQFVHSRCDALDITMVIGTQKEFIARLLDESLDLAIVVGDVAEEGIVTFPLFEESFALVTNPKGPFGHVENIRVEELPSIPLILQEQSTGVHMTVQKYFQDNDVTPTVLMEGINSDITKSFLLKRHSASLLVRLAVQKEINDKVLHEIHVEGGGPIARFQLAMLERNQHKPHLQCFLQNAVAFPFKEFFG